MGLTLNSGANKKSNYKASMRYLFQRNGFNFLKNTANLKIKELRLFSNKGKNYVRGSKIFYKSLLFKKYLNRQKVRLDNSKVLSKFSLSLIYKAQK
jgi:hypothetical protein